MTDFQIDFNAWLIHDKKMVAVGSLDYFDNGQMHLNDEYQRGQFRLLQYSQLKDKNNRRLYVGDIFFSEDGEFSKTIVIDEREDCLGLNFRDVYTNDVYNEEGETGDQKDILYLGNIYENPELLTK